MPVRELLLEHFLSFDNLLNQIKNVHAYVRPVRDHKRASDAQKLYNYAAYYYVAGIILWSFQPKNIN